MDIRYILRNIFLIFHVKVRFSNIECHLSLSSICILFIREQKTRKRKKKRKKKDVEKEEKNIKRGGASTKYNKIRIRK